MADVVVQHKTQWRALQGGDFHFYLQEACNDDKVKDTRVSIEAGPHRIELNTEESAQLYAYVLMRERGLPRGRRLDDDIRKRAHEIVEERIAEDEESRT